MTEERGVGIRKGITNILLRGRKKGIYFVEVERKVSIAPMVGSASPWECFVLSIDKHFFQCSLRLYVEYVMSKA